MAFLELNGYPIEILNATVAQEQTKRAQKRKSFRGMMRDPRRGIRRKWNCVAKFQEMEEARGLEGLIQGRGHVIDFRRGMVAEEPGTGLAPSFVAGTTTGPTPSINPGMGRRGLGFLEIDDGDALPILRYPAQLTEDWTVIMAETQGDGDWILNAERSDGVTYREGVEQSLSSGFFFSVLNGDLDVNSDCGCEVAWDDLIILPYRASRAQMAAWTTEGVSKWGPLPVLRMTGDIIDKRATFVVGDLTGSPFTQIGGASVSPPSAGGAAWANNAKVIRFTLNEVDDQYLSGSALAGARAVKGFEDTDILPARPYFWYDAAHTRGIGNVFREDDQQYSTWNGMGVVSGNAAAVATNPVFRKIDIDASSPFFHPHFEFANLGGMETGAIGFTGTIRNIIALVGRFDSLASSDYMLDGSVGGISRCIVRGLPGGVLRARVTADLDSPAGTIVDNQWFYAVLDFNGANSVMRVNGRQVATGSMGSLCLASGITIGEQNQFSGGGFDLDGAVAEVALWRAEGASADFLPDDTAANPYKPIEDYLRARYPELA